MFIESELPAQGGPLCCPLLSHLTIWPFGHWKIAQDLSAWFDGQVVLFDLGFFVEFSYDGLNLLWIDGLLWIRCHFYESLFHGVVETFIEPINPWPLWSLSFIKSPLPWTASAASRSLWISQNTVTIFNVIGDIPWQWCLSKFFPAISTHFDRLKNPPLGESHPLIVSLTPKTDGFNREMYTYLGTFFGGVQ